VLNLLLNTNNPDAPELIDLKTSVTIGTADFLAALEKAAANAK